MLSIASAVKYISNIILLQIKLHDNLMHLGSGDGDICSSLDEEDGNIISGSVCGHEGLQKRSDTLLHRTDIHSSQQQHHRVMSLSTCLVPSVDRGPFFQEKVDGIGIAGEGRVMQWCRSDLYHVLRGQAWCHTYQSGQFVKYWCRLYLVKHFRVGGVWLFIVDNL